MSEEKSKKPQMAWDVLDENTKEKVMDFNEDYLKFLNEAKTEREAIWLAQKLALKEGFVDLKKCSSLKVGDKVYWINYHKEMILAVIGEESLDKGLNIIGAHVDSPRLDFKPKPLYEHSSLALAKTHYYGGIKKYHWVGIPLALHGVVIKEDGSQVNFVLGEKAGEPVFTISDLLPHLAKEQMNKKLSEGIEGENLNILVGGIPLGEGSERLKESVIVYLEKTYGIKEEDLISAEIEAVPAFLASSVGFDGGLVGGYGQDDRVCAYTALRALLETKNPKRTALLLLVDKEEIGSVGNTGMESMFFETFVAKLLKLINKNADDLQLRLVLAASKAISADVNAALDPNYPSVMDNYNSAILGCGVSLTKYTGSRGKSGSNDASAEFVALMRKILNQNKVFWQIGELGKVDQGGGGTIAYMMANYNMEVIDCGVALLGMHSTFEISSKVDVYMTYQAYQVFFAHV